MIEFSVKKMLCMDTAMKYYTAASSLSSAVL